MDTHQPIRSISLPSRLHPTCERFEAVSHHLKSNYICNQIEGAMVGLAELYNCVEDSLHHCRQGKLVEYALQVSVTLLDACDKARDKVSTLKEHVHTLQSALRRRRSDAGIESTVADFMSFRKKVKKDITKQLVAVKRMENTVNSYPLESDVGRNLIEASSITISIFRGLLVYLTMPETKARKPSPFLAKLLPLRLFEKEHKVISGIEKSNVALYSLIGNSKTKVEVKEIQGMLETVSINSEGLERALNGIYRCLVKHRVSLLNVFTH